MTPPQGSRGSKPQPRRSADSTGTHSQAGSTKPQPILSAGSKGGGGLERTDILTVSTLGGCGGLERTDF